MLSTSRLRTVLVVSLFSLLALSALPGIASARRGKTAPKNSVTSKSIKNGQVKTADLAKKAVAGKNVKPNSLNGAQINELSLDLPSWSLTGNAGTTPGTDFLGTTDNRALEIKVNGQRALRIEPTAAPNIVGGYSGNSVDFGATGATIAGGGAAPSPTIQRNSVHTDFGAVGGGIGNIAGDPSAPAGGKRATVGGGAFNTASGFGAVVAGGGSNFATAAYSSVAGGFANEATGDNSSVLGGSSNEASGATAVVAGGSHNTAAGTTSFAAGFHANIPATDDGTFAFADGSNINDFDPGGSDRFSVRSAGGAYFVTATNPTTGAGTAGVYVAPGGGSWSSLSDRHSKTNIERISPRAVLRKLSDVPVHRWSYKTQNPSIRHMGPMAQTFRKAFGLGEDRTHIDDIDAQGVALTAIKGAALKIRSQHRQLHSQHAQLRTQARQIEALQKAVGKLKGR